MKQQHLNELFSADEQRFDNFSIQLLSMLLDYSKNLVNEDTIKLLLELAEEC